MLTKAIFKSKEAATVCPEFPLHPQHSMICNEPEPEDEGSFVQPGQGGGKETGVAVVPQLLRTGSSQGAPPSLSPPAQDWIKSLRRTKTTFSPVKQRGQCWGNNGLAGIKESWAQIGDKSRVPAG